MIRTLNRDELDESITLSCFAFQYEVSDEEREHRKTRMNPDRTWGYFIEDKLAAKIYIHDLHVYVHGRPFRMGGVASVATWPEYRRKGMVSQLLRRGLEAMKEDGQTLSCLSPFSVSFYRKYGWELYTDYKKYELTSAQLPREDFYKGRVERSDRNWELLNRVYDRYARSYNGMLVRDEGWWKHTVFKQKGGQAAVYFDESGEPTGYMLYTVKNRIMDIGELVHVNDDARKGMWRFIANHDSMCEKVKLKAPADDELPFLLADPRIVQETVPYFMARIVDFQSFVEQYPFEATGSGQELRIRLNDADAPWNDAIFIVKIDGAGRGTAEKETGGDADSAPYAECGIGTMTAMLMGYKRPAFMARTGRLGGNAEEALRWERVVPARATYLPDYY